MKINMFRSWCPSINEIFSLSSRRAEILTAGIWLIFRGLKFPPNNEIGENSHLGMDTSWQMGILRAEI